MWLAFEDESVDFDGAAMFPDALGGPFEGRVVSSGGGAVERTAGAGRSGPRRVLPRAVRRTSGCPRAILEVAPDSALDPGESDFEFGASVWLAPDQTTRGSNIVQKGRFAAGDGLWKLQVDSDEGEPSCVIRSGSDLLTVRSRSRSPTAAGTACAA